MADVSTRNVDWKEDIDLRNERAFPLPRFVPPYFFEDILVSRLQFTLYDCGLASISKCPAGKLLLAQSDFHFESWQPFPHLQVKLLESEAWH